jgi:hypothetical protein
MFKFFKKLKIKQKIKSKQDKLELIQEWYRDYNQTLAMINSKRYGAMYGESVVEGTIRDLHEMADKIGIKELELSIEIETLQGDLKNGL